MTFEDYKTKKSVVIVYTGDGKGKTSAGIGLLSRALGNGMSVAFIQFIKHWEVSEHKFIKKIQPLFKDKLYFYKGGKGFYNAGKLSAENVSKEQHVQAAEETFNTALRAAESGDYDLVICDEINNAVFEGLLPKTAFEKLIDNRSANTSLCFTGRNFPKELLDKVDIASNMTKMRHHFDKKFLANEGIDY